MNLIDKCWGQSQSKNMALLLDGLSQVSKMVVEFEYVSEKLLMWEAKCSLIHHLGQAKIKEKVT